MVQPETANVTTRLQGRIDAHEEKIQLLSGEVQILTSTVSSMKESLNKLPDSLEKLMINVLKHQGKHHMGDTGSVFDEGDGSGSKTPRGDFGFLFNNLHSDDSLFSLPKVKLPLFDGHDPRGWITKAELYFKVHETPNSIKLQLVQMCMDGVALNWFTNLIYKHPQTDWNQFRKKLMLRFSGTRFLNAYEALGSLNQEGDVEEYIEHFEALSALIPDQSEEQSVGLFLRGLRDDIKNWVRTLNPITCDEAMDGARRIELATGSAEEKTDPGGSHARTNGGGYFQAHPRKSYLSEPGPMLHRPTHLDHLITQHGSGTQHSNLGSNTSRHPETANHNRTSGTRHLTKMEWEDRRKRGLCFGCGQKFSPQHRCAESSLRIMLLADGELVDDDGQVYNSEEAVT